MQNTHGTITIVSRKTAPYIQQAEVMAVIKGIASFNSLCTEKDTSASLTHWYTNMSDGNPMTVIEKIDQFHKSQNAPASIPQCCNQNRNVHISVLNGV